MWATKRERLSPSSSVAKMNVGKSSSESAATTTDAPKCGSVFETFASSTTAHGVAHLVDAKSTIRKLIWLIVVLGVFSGFSYHLSTLVKRYISRPVNVAMTVETPPSLTFPAVTICNVNPIRKSAIENNDVYSDILMASATDVAQYEIIGGSCLDEDLTCIEVPDRLKYIVSQTCIKPYMECNKNKDCDNFADEAHCYRLSGTNCGDGMFTCINENCIPEDLLCNYVDNCGDGSDETLNECPQFANSTCTSGEWRCANGQCIPSDYMCDNYIDCGDMSDETECTDGAAVNVTVDDKEPTTPGPTLNCRSDEFPCGDHCMVKVHQCDGISDCPRGSDESNCNYTYIDPFEGVWYEPYESIIDDKGIFENFKTNVYQNRGFDFIPTLAEDPPIWRYFFISSKLADYSDLRDVMKLTKEQIRTFGHQLEDMVLDCSFAGEKCNLSSDFVSFQNEKFGNCYTFNSGKKLPLSTTSRPGPENGLTLTLYLEQQEYTALFGQAAGIRVEIHSQNDTAFPEDRGLGLSPGTYTHMGLRRFVRERKGDPYGKCDDSDFLPTIRDDELDSKTRYSLLSCQKNCLQTKLLQYCGCIIGTIRSNVSNPVPLCGVLNVTQTICSQLIHHLYQIGKLECDCEVPCHEESFKPIISQYVWPSNSYKDGLLSTSYGQNIKTWQLTGDDVRENLMRLAIYYEDLNYERVYEEPAYELSQLWADIGGALGLWIGVSCVTVIEFFEFLVNLCLLVKRRASPSHVTP